MECLERRGAGKSVTIHNMHSIRCTAVCQRYPCRLWRSDHRGHPGHHLHRHTGGPAGQDLLTTTPEDETVTALETGDRQTPLRPVDEDPVDLLLWHRMAPRRLADIDDLHPVTDPARETRRTEPVVHDHIGRLQDALGTHRHEVTGTRATAEQDHASCRRTHRGGRQCTGVQHLLEPVTDLHHATRVRGAGGDHAERDAVH